VWNQLPEEALATFLCKSHIFRNKVKKLIISEENEGFLKRGDEKSKSAEK
jgi:hypothetical protein